MVKMGQAPSDMQWYHRYSVISGRWADCGTLKVHATRVPGSTGQGEKRYALRGLTTASSRWLAENGPRELELLFSGDCLSSLRAHSDRRQRPPLSGRQFRRRQAARACRAKRSSAAAWMISPSPASSLRFPNCGRLFCKEGSRKARCSWWVRTEVRARLSTPQGNVLPVRHLLVLRDKTAATDGRPESARCEIPAWVQDYALFLLECRRKRGRPGIREPSAFTVTPAPRRSASMLPCSIPPKTLCAPVLEEELKRAAAEGHFGNEGWCMRKDGSRFWANVITMALKDESGNLQGFAQGGARFQRAPRAGRETARHRARAPASAHGNRYRRHRFRRVRPHSGSQRRVSRTGRLQPRRSADGPSALARSDAAGIFRAGRTGA